MKKLLLTLLFAMQSSVLAGCWDRIEINDVALVTGLGIDQINEKNIELTAEMHIPRAIGGAGNPGGGSSSGNAQTFIRSGVGRTIADAISDLQQKIPRRVFWGQTKVVVFGEAMAKNGIREQLDFLTRHSQPRLRSYMFVANGTAKDILVLLPPLERASSEVLREMAVSEVLKSVTLKELLQMVSGDGQGASMPMVKKLTPEPGKKWKETIAYIHQTAIFKKDKMIGSINDNLTRGLLWIRDEIKEANITIEPEKGEGYVSSRILRADTELIPRVEDGKWKVTVKASTTADVIVNGSDLNLMNPEIVLKLQKKLEEDIEHLMARTVQLVQKEMHADIFGFAEQFHRKYPQSWKSVKPNWEERFPAVEVAFEVKANIRRPGLSGPPQGLPEEEVKQR